MKNVDNHTIIFQGNNYYTFVITPIVRLPEKNGVYNEL